MVSRPFADLIGQSQAVELLSRAITQQRIAPAYLFAGPAGVGRRLAAIAFATMLLRPTASSDLTVGDDLRQRVRDRNHPDLLWVEPTYSHQGKLFTQAEAIAAGIKRRAAPQIRLEQVRDISRFLSRPPLAAPRAVVVIDGAETMAESAANGLLKTLEEPHGATLILLAPDLETLLPTIISRCQRIPFYRLSRAETQQVLTQTGHAAVLDQAEPLAIAQGSPGQAVTIWDSLQLMPAELLSQLRSPPPSPRQALDLARQIHQALDPETQLWLVDYLQHCYWQPETGSTVAAIAQMTALEQARQWLRSYVQPRLVWEVTLLTIGGFL